MKRYYIIFTLILIIIVSISIFVYIKYAEDISFSPNIFLTEMLKFMVLTVTWTLILELYNSFNNRKKKMELVNILLFSVIIRLQQKLKGELHKNELQTEIDLIQNNINIVKLLPILSATDLIQLSQFENKINNDEFKNHIENLEFLIEKKIEYINTESYKKINKELNQITYVFRN